MKPLKAALEAAESKAEFAEDQHSATLAGGSEQEQTRALEEMNERQLEARAARANADLQARTNGFDSFAHWEVIEVRADALGFATRL